MSLSPKANSAVETVSFSLTTGTAPSFEQARERGAGVQEAVAVHDVAPREEDLRAGDAPLGEDVRVGLREARLPGGGARLKRRHVARARVKAEDVAARRGGAGRDDDDPRSLCDKARQPGRRAI